MQAIIHVASGKVLFDSQQEQIGVLSRHVLPQSGRLLIIGVKPKTLMASLFMYDIVGGQQLWSNDEMFKADALTAHGLALLAQVLALAGTEGLQEVIKIQVVPVEPVELARLAAQQSVFAQLATLFFVWEQNMPATNSRIARMVDDERAGSAGEKDLLDPARPQRAEHASRPPA